MAEGKQRARYITDKLGNRVFFGTRQFSICCRTRHPISLPTSSILPLSCLTCNIFQSIVAHINICSHLNLQRLSEI